MNKWRQKRSAMQKYDVTAKMYDARYAEEQEVKYKAAFTNVNVTGSVLDVGCGTGLMFSHVANQAEAVVGVDISRKQLLKAREQAKSFSNVHLVHADADHLPVKGDYFMMVFAFTVLQNMPSPPETLRELKRAGKRGGSIVVSGLKKTFSLEVFGALLQKTGLRVVFCEDNKRLKCYVAVGTQD